MDPEVSDYASKVKPLALDCNHFTFRGNDHPFCISCELWRGLGNQPAGMPCIADRCSYCECWHPEIVAKYVALIKAKVMNPSKSPVGRAFLRDLRLPAPVPVLRIFDLSVEPWPVEDIPSTPSPSKSKRRKADEREGESQSSVSPAASAKKSKLSLSEYSLPCAQKSPGQNPQSQSRGSPPPQTHNSGVESEALGLRGASSSHMNTRAGQGSVSGVGPGVDQSDSRQAARGVLTKADLSRGLAPNEIWDSRGQVIPRGRGRGDYSYLRDSRASVGFEQSQARMMTRDRDSRDRARESCYYEDSYAPSNRDYEEDRYLEHLQRSPPVRYPLRPAHRAVLRDPEYYDRYEDSRGFRDPRGVVEPRSYHDARSLHYDEVAREERYDEVARDERYPRGPRGDVQPASAFRAPLPRSQFPESQAVEEPVASVPRHSQESSVRDSGVSTSGEDPRLGEEGVGNPSFDQFLKFQDWVRSSNQSVGTESRSSTPFSNQGEDDTAKRTDTWKGFVEVVEDFVPSLPEVQSTPIRQYRTVGNEEDQEAEEYQLPLHPNILAACHNCSDSILHPVSEGSTDAPVMKEGTFFKTQRKFTHKFLNPKGNRSFAYPAIRNAPDTLQRLTGSKASQSVKSSTFSEKELENQEVDLRESLICWSHIKYGMEALQSAVLSSDLDIDALATLICNVERQQKSLATMLEDRLVVSLQNTVLRRRDLFLAAPAANYLPTETKLQIRASPLAGRLLMDIPDELIRAESEDRSKRILNEHLVSASRPKEVTVKIAGLEGVKSAHATVSTDKPVPTTSQTSAATTASSQVYKSRRGRGGARGRGFRGANSSGTSAAPATSAAYRPPYRAQSGSSYRGRGRRGGRR